MPEKRPVGNDTCRGCKYYQLYHSGGTHHEYRGMEMGFYALWKHECIALPKPVSRKVERAEEKVVDNTPRPGFFGRLTKAKVTYREIPENPPPSCSLWEENHG